MGARIPCVHGGSTSPAPAPTTCCRSPAGPPEQPLLEAAETRLALQGEPAGATAMDEVVRLLRATAAGFAALDPTPAPGIEPGAFVLPQALDSALAHGDENVRALLLARVDRRLRALAPRGQTPSRRLAVERAVAPLLFGRGPLVAETASWNAPALAAVISGGRRAR